MSKNKNKNYIKLVRQGLYDKNNKRLTYIDPDGEVTEITYSLEDDLSAYHDNNITITIETTVDALPVAEQE